MSQQGTDQTQTENISKKLTSSFSCKFLHGQDGMYFPSALIGNIFLWLAFLIRGGEMNIS